MARCGHLVGLRPVAPSVRGADAFSLLARERWAVWGAIGTVGPDAERPECVVTNCETHTRPQHEDAAVSGAIEWLESEFPGWQIEVDETATWTGHRPLWIARRDDHHPQAELSPAKLHTRLSEYLERETRRRPSSN